MKYSLCKWSQDRKFMVKFKPSINPGYTLQPLLLVKVNIALFLLSYGCRNIQH